MALNLSLKSESITEHSNFNLVKSCSTNKWNHKDLKSIGKISKSVVVALAHDSDDKNFWANKAHRAWWWNQSFWWFGGPLTPIIWNWILSCA